MDATDVAEKVSGGSSDDVVALFLAYARVMQRWAKAAWASAVGASEDKGFSYKDKQRGWR